MSAEDSSKLSTGPSNGQLQGQGTPGIRAVVHDSASSAYAYASRSIDRLAPPSRRQAAYDDAQARPVLYSFLVAQLVFCFLPALVFLVFAVSTAGFAFGAALVFALFWIGVAFMLLVPALLAASSIALLVWIWAVGSFLVAQALYKRLPTSNPPAYKVEDKGVQGKIGQGRTEYN